MKKKVKLMLKIAVCLLLLLFSSLLSYSAGRTWTFSGAGGWNTASNWNPNGVPNANTEAVVIDIAGAAVTLDTKAMCSTFTIGTSQSCTLTLSASNSLTVNANFTINSNGYISYNSNGSPSISVLGDISFDNASVFIAGSGTGTPALYIGKNSIMNPLYIPSLNCPDWNFVTSDNGINIYLQGNLTCKNFQMLGSNSNIFNLQSFTLNCNGDFIITGQAVFNKGTGKIIFDKGDIQTFNVTNNSDLGNIEVSNSGTTVTCMGSNKVFSNLLVDVGCEFKNAAAGSTITMSENNTGITVFGTLNLKDCSLRSSHNYALTVDGGNVWVTVVSIRNCDPVNVDVDATNGCVDLGGNSSRIIFALPLNSQTWDGRAGDSDWQNGANWSNSSIPGAASSVRIINAAVTNAYGCIGDLTLGSCSLSLSGDLTVSNFITVASGVTVNSGFNNLIIKKDIVNAGGDSKASLVAGAGNLKLNGVIPQIISWIAPDWSIQNSNTSGYTVSPSRGITCINLTLDPVSNFTTQYNLTIKGNADFEGGFKNTNNTVFFNAGILQNLSANKNTLGNVRLSQDGTTLNILSSGQFQSLIIDASTTFQDITDGTTVTINNNGSISLNGSLILRGSSWAGSGVYLRASTLGGAVFTLNNNGTISWDYLGIQGCSASAFASLDVSDLNINNLGYNKNFIFPARNWIGGASGSWSVPGNWEPPNIPTTLDNVTISNANVSNAAGTINSLTISGAGSTLGLPVSGILDVKGDISIPSGSVLTGAGSSKLSVGGNLEVSGDVQGKDNILCLDGEENQDLTAWTGVSWDIVINNASGAVVTYRPKGSISTLYCSSLTVAHNSNFDPNNQNLSVLKNLIIDGNLTGTLNSLTFSATQACQLMANDNHLGDVRINQPNTIVTLLSGARFKSLSVLSSSQFVSFTPGTTIIVDAGSTINIGMAFAGQGTFKLAGASGNLIKLQSSSSSKFNLSRNMGTIQMAYVDIHDCHGTGGITVSRNCPLTNSDGISYYDSLYRKTWKGGGGDNQWDTDGNWDPTGVPNSFYDVIVDKANIDHRANSGAVASLTFTESSLTLNTYTLAVNGGLTVSSDCALYGTSFSGIISAKGDITIDGSTAGTAALKCDGSAVQSLNWAGNTNWNVSINNTSLVTLTRDLNCRNITVFSNCDFLQGGSSLTVYGSMVLNGSCTLGNASTSVLGPGLTVSGALTQGGNGALSVAGNFTINPAGKFYQGSGITYISGDCILNNNAVSSFVKGTGKLLFNKGSSQTLKVVTGDDIGNLHVTNNSTVSLTTSMRFTNLLIDSNSTFRESIAGKTLTVTSGGAVTVDGVLSIAGSSSATTTLTTDNSTAGAAGFSVKTDNNTINISLSYVKIRNCTPVAGKIDAMDNCLSLGGNDTDHIYFSAVGKTWLALGTGDWANASNWSEGIVPDATHDVIINVDNTVITNVSGFIHSLVLLSRPALTLSGNLNINAGVSADNTVTLDSGSSYTLAVKGNVILPYTVSGIGNLQMLSSSTAPLFAFNGASWNIKDSNTSYTITMSGGGVTCKDLIIDNSAGLNASIYDVSIQGSAYLTGAYYKSNKSLLFNGGTLQSLYSASSNSLGNVRVTATNTTLSLISNINLSNLTIDTGTHFKDITGETTISVDSTGSITVAGILTLQGTSWGTGSVSLKSSSSNASFLLTNTGTINVGYLNISGCTVASSVFDYSANTVNNLGNNANIIFPIRTWTGVSDSNWSNINNWYPPYYPVNLDNVIINVANSNITNASGSLDSLTIGASNVCTLSGSLLTVLGNPPLGVTVGASGAINGLSLNSKGHIYCASGSSVSGPAITLNGDSAQVLRWPGYITDTLTISNNAALVTLNNAAGATLYCNNIIVNTGSTLQINTQTVQITGTAAFSGALLSNTSTTLIFNKNTGLQNLTASNNTLGHIIVQSGSGKTTLNVNDSLILNRLVVSSNAQFQTLNAGTTIKVSGMTAYPAGGISVLAGGAFLSAGSLSNRNLLKCLDAGQSFKFIFDSTGGSRVNCAYVNISDCNAGSGSAIYVPNNCVLSNTTNIIISSSANAKSWSGAFNTSWNNELNWIPTGITNLIDDIIIPFGTINSAYGTINSLTIAGTASLTLHTTTPLVINDFCTVSGCTVVGYNAALQVKGNIFASALTGTGNLNLTGTTWQSINWQGPAWSITFSNNNLVTLANSLACNNFAISADCNFSQGSYSITAAGNFTVNGSCTLGSGNVNIGGNVYLNNTGISSFTRGTGKLIFNKGGNQYLSARGYYDIGNLQVTNSSTVLLTTSAHFTNLTIDADSFFTDQKAGTTITVTDGGKITVNGTLTVAGAGSGVTTVITTDNLNPGMATFSIKTGALNTNLSYAGIRNCTPVYGIVDATNNCYNLEGNDQDGIEKIYFSPTAKTWTGTAGDKDWITPGNWSDNTAPDPVSDVIVNVTDTAITNISGSLYSLTVLSPSSLTLSGSLTIIGNINASAAINFHSGSFTLGVKKDVNLPFPVSGTGNLQLVTSTSNTSLSFNAPDWNFQNSNIYSVYMAGGLTCKNLILDDGSKLYAGSLDLLIKGTADFNGNFYKGAGAMVFGGGNLQTVSGSALANTNLGTVRLANTNTTLSLLNSMKFENLTIDSGTHFKDTVGGTTITIYSNSGFITVMGTLTLQGSTWGTGSVYLRNSTSAKFVLSRQTGAAFNLTYVSLSGCTGVSASDSILDLSSYLVNNLGNNANINFPPRSWINGAASSWTGADNWWPPAAPNILDNIIINTTNSIVTNASGSINSLTIGTSNPCTLADSASSGLTVLSTADAVSVGNSGYVSNVILNSKGNVLYSGTNATLNIKNLTLSGNSAQTLKWCGRITNALNINPSAVVVFNNSAGLTLSCTHITLNNGSSLQVNAQAVKISGNAVFGGSLLFSSSAPTLIFSRNSGVQNLTATNNTLGHVFINSSSSNNTLNLQDSAFLYSLTVGPITQFSSLVSGITVSINPSYGITVMDDGSFMFAGSYGSRSILRSFNTTSSFKFYYDSVYATAKFAYTDISYCNASGGSPVYVPDNCSIFHTANIIPTSGWNNMTWTGAADNNWSNTGNWDTTAVPSTLDDIIIPNGASNYPSNASGTIASLTCEDSSELSISGSLIVNGHCTVGNVIKGGTLYVKGNIFGANATGSGILNLSGNTWQSIDWHGNSWNVVISNISSYGVTSLNEFRCSNFTLNSNAKYNQGANNLLTLGNMIFKSGSSFTIGSDNDVTVGNISDINGNCTFGINLYVTSGLTVSSAGNCTLGTGNSSVNGSFTVSGINVCPDLSNLAVSGNMTINTTGTFTQQGSAGLSVGGNALLNGVFNQGTGETKLSGSYIFVNPGKFNKGAGTIKFLRGSLQTLDANNNNLGKVEIINSATTLYLADSVEFTSLIVNSETNLICNSNNNTFAFGNTMVNGIVNITGSRNTLRVQPKPDNGIVLSAAGAQLKFAGNSGTNNYVALISAQRGSQFNLTANGVNSVSLKYAFVGDCDASSGSLIEGPYCLDLGNNLNVFFGSIPPASINDVRIRQTAGAGDVELGWTAVGTEGRNGRATSYIVKYSTVNITTQEQFDSAPAYSQSWVPLASGAAENYTLAGLTGADIWYVAIEAVNFVPMQADLSSISEFIVRIDPTRPVSYSLPGERGNVNIEIPVGTFSQNVEITGRELSSAQMPAVSDQPEFKATGLGASFSIFPVEKIKQPLKLKIKYEAKDITGLNADKLKIAFYNDTMGKWYHLKSKSDSVSKSVNADLKHLTTFRVVEYTYLGLYTVKVFPNPWKVGTGGSFDSGELTFKNLPEKGRIRIYNVAGEMARDISITEADDGFYSWDGMTDAGKKVSSGVYIAYVEDNEGNHRLMKVAVIR